MLSLIIPAYNEEANIPELFRRIEAIAHILGTYEIIIIDDGSRDRTVQLIEEEILRRGDANNITLISLTRNFGHQIALSAGLDQANGDAVIILDADLQDPPEVIASFIDQWKAGSMIVYGVRKKRKESWWKRSAYAGFYRLLVKLADISIPLDAGDFCLMDREVVKIIRSMPERNRFLRGLRAWSGYRSTAVEYERAGRFAGEPKYSIKKLMGLAMDGIIGFSAKPLNFAMYLGLTIAAASILLGAYLIVRKLTVGIDLEGWSSLMVSTFFLGGIQLFCIGVLGEYIGRIYKETQRRPLYIVGRLSGRATKNQPKEVS